MYRLDELSFTDIRILGIIYGGKFWHRNGFTIAEIASRLQLKNETVRYRMEKVLFPKGFVDKCESKPIIYKPVCKETVYVKLHEKIEKVFDDLNGW